jgi:hypothetical protein
MFGQDDSLTNHPAKRNVMAFLRVMVVDSLSLPPTPKLPPVIDSILDAQPELSTPAQQNRFVFLSFWKKGFKKQSLVPVQYWIPVP